MSTSLPMRVAYVVYLLTASAGMVFAVLWMTSPGFRYWLFRQGQELTYRWASWEYRMRSEPVPDSFKRLFTEPTLPAEE